MFNNEDGFTVVELVLAVSVTTISIVVFFMLIGDTNRVSLLSKENHFGEQLIDSYVTFYENVEINKDNVHEIVIDTGREDLVNNINSYMLEDESNSLPNHFRNTEVICNNTPRITDNSKYIRFDIRCNINGNPINKGNSYVVKRYINGF